MGEAIGQFEKNKAEEGNAVDGQKAGISHQPPQQGAVFAGEVGVGVVGLIQLDIGQYAVKGK